MMGRVRTLWQSRSPRERFTLSVLGVLVAAVLLFTLMVQASRARPPLRTAVLTLRADAVRLEQYAQEIERLRGVRPPVASQTDLRTLIQAHAASAGLAGALVRLDAPDANQVQLVFGAIPFADWLNWVAALGAQNVRLETCRVEAMAKPGLVSVTASFVRSGSQ